MAMALTGCESDSPTTTATTTPTTSNVSGIASKGPLNGATVCAFSITNGLKSAALGTCATTSSTGNYNIDLGSYIGPVLFEATGGTYVDEATGNTVMLAATLHSMLSSMTSGATTAAITPLTEVAYQMANTGTGALTSANIQAAIASVQNKFGVADIVGTLPVDALNLPAGATGAQKTYALALATVSQYLNGQTGSTLASALQALQSCLSTPTTCGTIGTNLNSAMGTFMAGHTGFTGVTLPVASIGSASSSVGGTTNGGGSNAGSATGGTTTVTSTGSCSSTAAPAGMNYSQSGNTITVTTTGCIAVPTAGMCTPSAPPQATGINVLVTSAVQSFQMSGIAFNIPGIPNPFDAIGSAYAGGKTCMQNAPSDFGNLNISYNVCYDISSQMASSVAQMQSTGMISVSNPITIAAQGTSTMQTVADCATSGADSITDAFTGKVSVKQANGSYLVIN
jgi:hypothetical protein